MVRAWRLIDHPLFVPGCVSLYLLLRLTLIFGLPLEQFSDARWYLARGMDFAADLGYSERGVPTAFWPVGYPGFLGLLFGVFGPKPLYAQLANAAFGAATLLLMLPLSRLAFGNERVGRMAILLLAIYPNNGAYAALLLTESFFTFFLVSGVYLVLCRRGRLALAVAGLVFGVAALTKPQILFIPVFLLGLRFLVASDEKGFVRFLRGGVLVYALMACVILPWSYRNYLVFGDVILVSTNGGVTLLTGNNPSADGGLKEFDPLVKKRRFSVADQVAADKRARQLALDWIRDNPNRFIELLPRKVWHLWAKDGESEWSYQAGYEHYDEYWYVFRGVRILNQAYYVMLILLFLASAPMVLIRRRDVCWPWILVGYGLITYFTLISMVFSGQPRFHFPVMPWVLMYAAWVMTVFTKGSVGEARQSQAVSSSAV